MSFSAQPYKRFTLLRHHRIKTLGLGDPNGRKEAGGYGAVGRWIHFMRLEVTPNAVPERFARNRVWCADTKWQGIQMDTSDPLIKKIRQEEYLADLARAEISSRKIGFTSKGKPGKIRKDSVFLEEILGDISPEWFRHGDMNNPIDEKRRKQFEDETFAWLQQEYGKRLLVVVSHADEENPHIGAWILPAVFKQIKVPGRVKAGQTRSIRMGWVLKSSDLFSGTIYFKDGNAVRGQCSVNQDKYAKHLQERGFDVVRGLEGSYAIHARMRAHAHRVHLELPELPILKLPEPKRVELAKSYHDRIIADVEEQLEKYNTDWATIYHKANEHDGAAKHRDQYQKTAERERRYRDELQTENQALLVKIKSLADQVAKVKGPPARIPTLSEVAEKLLPSAARQSAANTWQIADDKYVEVGDHSFQIWKVEKGEKSKLAEDESLLRLIVEITDWSVPVAETWLAQHYGQLCLLQLILTLARKTKPAMEKMSEQFQTKMSRLAAKPKDPQALLDWLSVKRGYPKQILQKWHDAGIVSLAQTKSEGVEITINRLAPNTGRISVAQKARFDRHGKLDASRHVEEAFLWRNSGKRTFKLLLVAPTPLDFLDLAAAHPDLLLVVDQVIANVGPNAPVDAGMIQGPDSSWLFAMAVKPEEAGRIRATLTKRGSTVDFADPFPFTSWASARDNMVGENAPEAVTVLHDKFGVRLKVIKQRWQSKPRQR